MKNKEKYAKEIVDAVTSGGYGFGFNKYSREIRRCNEVSCDECLFCESHGADECNKAKREWAESEYIEKPVISKRDKAFLELFNDKCKYIARDSNGELHGYELTAMKNEKMKIWDTTAEYVNIDYFFAVDFPMVKWSDSEPWLIEDLKKLEVVEEYE